MRAVTAPDGRSSSGCCGTPERGAIYTKVNETMAQDGPFAILYQPVLSLAVSKRLQNFLFDPVTTRSIHVDCRYILWNMTEVDGAANLLQEISIVPETSSRSRRRARTASPCHRTTTRPRAPRWSCSTAIARVSSATARPSRTSGGSSGASRGGGARDERVTE